MLLMLLACTAAGPPGFDVLVVSFDGTPRRLVAAEWDTLVTLPAIAAEGTRQDLVVEGATDTLASHARLLTGYGPEHTGAFSAHNFGVIPEGLSLPERLRAHFGPAVRLLYVANKPYMLGIEDETEPFWHLANACDVASNHAMAVDVTPLMLDALDTAADAPFFAFFHWSAVDETGHRYGEGSAEQRAALHDVDARLGEVRDALVASGRWERTLVYVTTDHGFPEHGHGHYEGAEEAWLVTTDPGVGTGTSVDQLPWTVLDRYGIEVDDPPPPVAPF